MLAAQADARWAAKGSLLERPKGAPVQQRLERGRVAAEVSGEESEAMSAETEDKRSRAVEDGTRREAVGKGPAVAEREENKILGDDPWKQARGGPSEEWQPKAWDGNIPAVKR